MQRIKFILFFLLCMATNLVFAASGDGSSCTSLTTTEQQYVDKVKAMFESPQHLWMLAQDPKVYAEHYSPSFVFYGNGLQESSQQFRNHMLQNIAHWKTSHQSGNTMKIVDIIAQCDKVVVRLKVSATAKSGKKYTLDSIEILKFNSKGQITHWWETAYPDWREMIKKEGEHLG